MTDRMVIVIPPFDEALVRLKDFAAHDLVYEGLARDVMSVLNRLSTPTPAVGEGTRSRLRDEILETVRSSLWSPASGPVEWTHEKIAAAQAQAQSLTDCIMGMVASLPLAGAWPAGCKLVPEEPGTCENDDSGWLLVFMHELHSGLPVDKRPTAWMQFSDDQRERIKSAYRAMLAASPPPPGETDRSA